jgi:probable rRNA maturation factor
MSAMMRVVKVRTMSEPRLDFIFEHEGWSKLQGLAERCERAVSEGLNRLSQARPGPAAVLLTNNEAVQALNARFRDKDRPTNVLSFPAPPSEGYPGDVALAYEICAEEAERDGKTLLDHTVHLVLHGVLHLNGLDHIKEDEAEEMEALEREALEAVGISDPYSVRTEP